MSDTKVVSSKEELVTSKDKLVSSKDKLVTSKEKLDSSKEKLVLSKEDVNVETTTATSIEKLAIIEEAESEPPKTEDIVKQDEAIELEAIFIENEIKEAKNAAIVENLEAEGQEALVEGTEESEQPPEEESEIAEKVQETEDVSEVVEVHETSSFVEVYVEDEPKKEGETEKVEDKVKSAQSLEETEKDADETQKPTHVWWKKKPPPPKLPCEILTPNDSQDPSYTNLKLPYSVICRQRYQKCAKMYRKQFIAEIKRQEEMQFRALDGIRIRREFCDPLIEHLPRGDRIRLSYRQQRRLDELLNAKT